jgi:hypothetical protein
MYSKPFKGAYPVTANRGWYSPFGQKIWHGGVDFGTPIGTPIYAFNDSTVVWSRWDTTGGGNMILLRDDQGVEVLYLHLDKRQVSEGQKVKGGQQIGMAGATGEVTGAHLHFEFWKDKPPENYGLIATDETAIKNLPARWDNRWVEPNQFNNQNIMSDKYNKLKSGIVEKLEKEANKGLPLDDGNKFGHQRGLIWVEDDPLGVFNQVFDAMASQTEKVEKLEAQLDEAPEAAVVEQLEAKQEKIDQLKQALDEKTQELNKTETDRIRVYNLLKECEDELEECENKEDFADNSENSSTKPIWKSKKVWVAGFSVLSMVAVNQGWLSAEGAQEITNEALAILEEVGVIGIGAVGAAYVLGQSQIDKAHIEKEKK